MPALRTGRRLHAIARKDDYGSFTPNTAKPHGLWNESKLARKQDRLGPPRNPQLFEQVRDVGLYRIRRESEPRGDLLVGAAVRQQLQDLPFALRNAERCLRAFVRREFTGARLVAKEPPAYPDSEAQECGRDQCDVNCARMRAGPDLVLEPLERNGAGCEREAIDEHCLQHAGSLTDPMSTRRRFLGLLAVPGLAMAAAPAVKALSRAAFVPEPSADDATVFAAARGHFLIPPGVAYCNTGTLGASPREVVDALAEGIRRLETDLAAWPYEQPDGEPLTGYQQLLDIRRVAGQFVNASAAEIALTQNATMGMNFLANGLDLAAGDEVVSTDQEHGGGISPWRLLAKRRGIVVKELPLEPAFAGGPEAVVRLFESAMSPRTKVVMFSHITSGLGALLPARELCALARSRGALAIVDGAQAVGQIQVDVKALGCDAYVGSPHKWMMAPKGTGFLYLRRDVQDRFWTTLASYQWENHEDGAFRFMQYGTGSVPVVDGLMATLRFIEKLGMPRIERWDANLTKRLRDGLAGIPAVRIASPADPRLSAAITTYRVDGVKAKALQDALWAKRIRVRAQNDERGVRVSTHLYVSPADVDVMLDVTREVAARA